MPFELVYHPDVKKIDLPKLDERSKTMIKRAIEERLSERPELFGRPLRGSLKGYWKLRVGNYRIVFKLAESRILVLAIIDRKTVYQ
jgi:mRNA interferase RelE/StbE